MSLRVDSTSLIPGALVCGNRGLGVIGSLIPATGDSGAAYCYNDLSLPADNAKEICGRITTWPTLGTLTPYEDTSFTYEGLTDTFQYQLYVDGVATGAPETDTLTVGAPVATLAITTSSTFSGSATVSPVATISLTTDSTFSGSASVAVSPSTATLSLTTDSTFSGSASVSPVATMDVAAGSVFSGSATVTPPVITASLSLVTSSLFSGSAAGTYVTPVITVSLSSAIGTRISLVHGRGVQMDTIFVGDVGTVIAMDCVTDVSSATVRNIIVRKPDGAKVTWTATQEGVSTIKYTTVDGDLNLHGQWKFQAYIEMPGWKGFGEVATLNVQPAL